jgi:hypothetical protein
MLSPCGASASSMPAPRTPADPPPPPPASAALASTWLTPAATSHWRRGACRAIGVLQEQFTELQNVLLSELRAAVGAVEAKEHAAVRPIEAEMVRDACVPT